MAQNNTQKVLGMINEAEVIAERKAMAKLLYHLNEMPGGFTKAKMAGIMGVSLMDFIDLYGDYMTALYLDTYSKG